MVFENDNDQFLYLGRWQSKKHFRAFVYNKKEEQKLANSYNEFCEALESGEWFASKELAKPAPLKAPRKAKDGTDS